MATENKYLPPIKISNEGSVAIEAVLAAGRAIRKAVGGKVEAKKGMSNVVTEADKASGRVIRAVLANKLGGYQILSEEGDEKFKNPLTVNKLWVVDELDGSKNFENKIDNVWVAIAYAEKGVVKVGVCYNPVLDKMYFAEKGKGAYYLGREYAGDKWVKEELSVSDQENLSKASIETSISYSPRNTISHQLIKLGLLIKGITPRFREIGSSVEQICRVAGGNSDLQMHSDLKPWDYAAASLILEEAGGVIRRMDGSKFNFMSPDSVCGNDKLVSEFIKQTKSTKAIRNGLLRVIDFTSVLRRAA